MTSRSILPAAEQRRNRPGTLTKLSAGSSVAARAVLAGLIFAPVTTAQTPAGAGRPRVSDCDALPCDVPPCDAPGRSLIYPFPVSPDSPLPRPPAERQPATDPDEDAADDPDAATDTETDAADPEPLPDDFGDFDPAAFDLDSTLASAGVQRGSFSSAPTMTGDFFGGGLAQVFGTQTQSFGYTLPGVIINGAGPGASNAVIGFGINGPPSDIFTTGTGIDSNNDQNIDRFSILEPIPPSSAGTSPGPGFLFDGGTAVFLGSSAEPGAPFSDGDEWGVNYSFSQTIGGPDGVPIVLAGPDVATRRVKLAENFSPEVRDRAYVNYNYFNNAIGGIGDVNRWVLGLERILIDDIFSVEFRLPMAGTLGSRQDINAPGNRNYELGNLTTIAKAVMLRSESSIWTAGMGVTAPLADDARLVRGNETLLKISNQAVHLLPFAAVMKRYNDDTILQFCTQLDIDANGNPIRGNLAGGSLPQLGRLQAASLIHFDASIHRTLVRRPQTAWVREVIGNAEIHYTGSLQDADVVTGNGLTVTDLARRFDVVNATFSNHLIMGDHVVVTPGFSVPLTTGRNRQFNFEAVLQVNYLR